MIANPRQKFVEAREGQQVPELRRRVTERHAATESSGGELQSSQRIQRHDAGVPELAEVAEHVIAFLLEEIADGIAEIGDALALEHPRDQQDRVPPLQRSLPWLVALEPHPYS